ncbi:MAG: PAS domain-containing protein [Evtepia gabavorous]
MLLLGIVIALGLSLGVSFLLNLIQESRSRDQTLSSAAQVAANTPVLMEDIHHTQATEYIRRTVRNVPSIDVFAVYDKSGAPVAFYDLASGADDPTLLTPLSENVMAWFTAGNDTMLYNGEAPSGTDRCAYAAIYSSEGELTGFVMVGIYMRSIQMMVLRMLLFHLLACVVALIAGSLLSLRLSRNIKEELLGYEPDAFRKLFLQRMDILDALDEGLLAIDENKCVTYLNRAASEILQIDQSAALGQPLKAVYPRSSIPG